MGVVLSYNPGISESVVFTCAETVHQPGRNSNLPQHDRHGGGKVLAMAGARFKKEHRKRVGASRPAVQVEAVPVASPEVALESLCSAEGIRLSPRDLSGQLRDPRVQARESQ